MDSAKSWERISNILVFDGGWQLPAKTELWAYESFKNQLPFSKFIEMVCFPWASLIDLVRKNQLQHSNWPIEALQNAPPKKTLKRATVCQHIYALDMIPWFKKLKITDLFWSHATKLEREIDGIKIHPFPLYPYVYASIADHKIKPLEERRYNYSFIGSYDPNCYLTNIRESIFALPKNDVSFIQKTSSWHFEELVYKQQISGIDLDNHFLNEMEKKEAFYTDVISESVFSLCPSGSGSNTIRFWESLMFGCVPVVLSDQWRAPSFLDEKNIIFLSEDENSLNEWVKLAGIEYRSNDLSKFQSINHGLSLDNLCMLSLSNNFLNSFS
jgi:hypothetical protein